MRYPIMKGIAVELPFVKFRYVKVDRGEPEKPESFRNVNISVPNEAKTPIAASKVIVSRQAETTTLGMDPMISRASVIHELTYGRIDQVTDFRQVSSYPAAFEPSFHSLDFIF